MSETNTGKSQTPTWQKLTIGILTILVAISTYVIVPSCDNKAETQPDFGKATQGVQEGIKTITSE